MKRFEYCLERVRRWRGEQAELEELRLGQLQAILQQLEIERQSLIGELKQAEASADATSPREMMQLPLFRRHMQLRIDAASRRIEQHKANIEKQRQRVVEARRRFELLDKLRVKEFHEWNAEFQKEQEELAAELFLFRHNRDL